MKKYELIKFLEPYMDDIEIDIHPAYQNDGIGRIINTLDINTKPPNDSTAICNWEHDECAEYNTWHTGCDGMFQITEGMPSENDMKYCPYCGKKIIENILSHADL